VEYKQIWHRRETPPLSAAGQFKAGRSPATAQFKAFNLMPRWVTQGHQIRCGEPMSVLDDFVRMRLYRERASEFELLGENEPLSEVRLRYRIIARHYRELADRDARNDKAKMAERLEMLKLARREAAE
jgi:hypothetical protein